jgi:dTDP-L-rhamnose 4-epimerase
MNKIHQLLGFKPSFSFEEGLKKFTDWVNTQTIVKSRFDESLNELKEKGLLK